MKLCLLGWRVAEHCILLFLQNHWPPLSFSILFKLGISLLSTMWLKTKLTAPFL